MKTYKQLIIACILSLGATQALYPMQRLGAIWGQLWGKKPAQNAQALLGEVQPTQNKQEVTIDGYSVNPNDLPEQFLPITPQRFTIANIEKYPQYKEEFIQYGLSRFDVPSISYKESLVLAFAIEHYADQIQRVTKKLLEKNSINIYPHIIALVMQYDPASIPLIAQQFCMAKSLPTTRTYTLQLGAKKSEFRMTTLNRLDELLGQIKDHSVLAKFRAVITKIVFEAPFTIPVAQLDIIYKEVLSKDEQEKLKAIFATRMQKITSANMLQLPIPEFVRADLLSKDTSLSYATQTKQHLLNNLKQGYCAQQHMRRMGKEELEFFLKVYAQEKVEHAHDNYVFYHGRQWSWNFIADMYKQLWNLTHEQQVGNNFQFLRFGEGCIKYTSGRDILFMNSALFGNMSFHPCSSASYWLRNHDQTKHTKERGPSIQSFFEKFGFGMLYGKHKDQYDNYIAQLEALHKKASKGRGELLLISVSSDKLDQVYLTDYQSIARQLDIKNPIWDRTEPSSNSKAILDTIKTSPQVIAKDLDRLEWGLILGNFSKGGSYTPAAYANDPYNGPAIYSFHDADEKIMAEYEALRDEFFAQIKKDMLAQPSHTTAGQATQPTHKATAGTATDKQIKSKL